MIEVENLTKTYGTFYALRDITFNVEQGEILGFLGPNGAGKTTTMRIITGYLPATAGTVRVAGFDVAEKSLDARRHLGYLPETVPLYTELTPFEYLDFRGRITGMHNGRERKARIYEIMDELNLGDVSTKLIGALSRGYRQRVGLAQALLHNPDALILDEPTVGLDPVQITEVRSLIKELGKSHTIILSTHLLPEVSMVCNRVIIINRGRLVALDTPIHMAEGAATSETVQLEVNGAPGAILGVLRSVGGVASATALAPQGSAQPLSPSGIAVTPVDETTLTTGVNLYQVEGQVGAQIRAALASAVVSAGFQLLELKNVRPSLEDIFIRVISQETEAEAEEAAEAEEGYEEGYEEIDGGDAYFEGESAEEAKAEADRAYEPVATATAAPTRVHTKRRARR